MGPRCHSEGRDWVRRCRPGPEIPGNLVETQNCTFSSVLTKKKCYVKPTQKKKFFGACTTPNQKQSLLGETSSFPFCFLKRPFLFTFFAEILRLSSRVLAEIGPKATCFDNVFYSTSSALVVFKFLVLHYTLRGRRKRIRSRIFIILTSFFIVPLFKGGNGAVRRHEKFLAHGYRRNMFLFSLKKAPFF